MPVAQDRVRAVLLGLPGVAEGLSYGTPAFRRGRTMIARFREDGVMVLRVDASARDVLIDTEPDAYFIEDHYRSHPLVLVRMEVADADRLALVIERS